MEEESEDNFNELFKLVVKAGFPTPQQYLSDPNVRCRVKKSKEYLLETVDSGQSLLKNVKKQKYLLRMIDGRVYEAQSLEKLQYIADCEGVILNECLLRPELREDTSCTITLEVSFVDKGVRREKKSSIII